MIDWDHLPADKREVRRVRLLAHYLRDEVGPFSTTEGRRLDEAGIDGRRVRSADVLARLEPVEPDGLDGIAAVLRPTSAGLSSSPERFGWWWATLTRRRAAFVDREVEPRFRPIHFDDHGPFVVASSAADLDRLADLGRRALGLAGVRRDDAVVSLLPAQGNLPFWHVTLGCRRAGVAALHLGDSAAADEVAAYAPSVLVGALDTLRRVGSARGDDVALDSDDALDSVHLVLVTERLDGDDRVDLAARFPRAAVRAMWSPPGVRAPWVECRAGNLHTWPDAEVIQIAERRGSGARGVGTIVWSPLGWRGTVVLRLRTGLRGRVIDVDTPCRCGATSPRLDLGDAAAPAPPEDALPPVVSAAAPDGDDDVVEARLARVLDREPMVASWFAEVRTGSTRPEVLVRLAPERGQRTALEADLARLGSALGVSRVIVERPSAVRERLEQSGFARVVEIS